MLVLASISLHEVGHYLGFRYYGVPVSGLNFSLLSGGSVRVETACPTLRSSLVVSFLGPLFGLFLALALAPLIVLTSSESVVTAVRLIVIVHVLNLVPYGPLDGGHIQRTLEQLVRNAIPSNDRYIMLLVSGVLFAVQLVSTVAILVFVGYLLVVGT